jgi:hypothetical protein
MLHKGEIHQRSKQEHASCGFLDLVERSKPNYRLQEQLNSRFQAMLPSE